MYRRYGDYRGHGISATWILIGIDIVVFIITLVTPSIIYNFGLVPRDLTSRPWIILTSMFIHNGFWHLFGNMWTLYFFGTMLSSIIGEKRYLAVYFIGGIVGGIFYTLLATPYSIAIGASGAIFALGGALAVLRPSLTVYAFPIPVPIPLWVAVIGGFFLVSILFPRGIAWQAHLGGLIAGLAIGYIYRKPRRFYIRRRH